MTATDILELGPTDRRILAILTEVCDFLGTGASLEAVCARLEMKHGDIMSRETVRLVMLRLQSAGAVTHTKGCRGDWRPAKAVCG